MYLIAQTATEPSSHTSTRYNISSPGFRHFFVKGGIRHGFSEAATLKLQPLCYKTRANACQPMVLPRKGVTIVVGPRAFGTRSKTPQKNPTGMIELLLLFLFFSKGLNMDSVNAFFAGTPSATVGKRIILGIRQGGNYLPVNCLSAGQAPCF